jgi:hypothetical protein
MKKPWFALLVVVAACDSEHERMPEAASVEASPVLSKENPVTKHLNRNFPSAREKTKAVLSELIASGDGAQDLRESGRRFHAALGQLTGVDEWNCFAAGCFFKVSEKNEQSALSMLLTARNNSGYNKTSAILPDESSQVIVVLN